MSYGHLNIFNVHIFAGSRTLCSTKLEAVSTPHKLQRKHAL